MLKQKTARLSALVLSVALVGGILAGCGAKSSTSTPAKSKDVQKVSYNLGADPKTIDPGLNNSVEGGTVIENAFEGLVDINEKEKAVPGVAEKWDISADGKTYTFHLRKDAKWSDGKAVTAKDFEYAWKRALDPATASDYAYQLYYLKNGQGFNESASKDADKTPGVKTATKDEVGVKATDDNTLLVTLENSTPYFLELTAFPTYMPVRQDVVEKDPKAWATKKETYISNGAFSIKDWALKSTITFQKNPNYWNKDKIKLDTIVYYLIDQESSAMAAFTTGQVDINDLIPAVQKPTLVKSGDAKAYPYIGTYYYCINVGDKANKANGEALTKALKDVNVRTALSLAVDRQSLVDNVTKGGEFPATGFVPAGMTDEKGKDFKNKEYWPAKGDVAKAQQLLSDAGYPGGKGFPKLEILYNTGQNHQNIAQAVQDMLKKNLGIEVTLRNVERKVQLDTLTKQQYQICRTGWIADYADPMTFLDMWVTNGGNNNAGYSNPSYDKLISAAKAETNAAKRMEDMHQAQDVLMKDLPIIPLYEYTNVVAIKSFVKDLHKSPLGFVYFHNTYIDKSTK